MNPTDSFSPLPVVSTLDRMPLTAAIEQAPPQPPVEERKVLPLPRPKRYMDALSVLKVVGDRVRWEVICQLSKGKPLAVRQLASRVGASSDLLSKHMQVLRQCGITRELPGKDARFRFQILSPEVLVRIEGDERIVDFGSCVLRFPH